MTPTHASTETAAAATVDLDELREAVRRFAAERDWGQFHDPKNLAMALAGEAGELAAELQWLTTDEARSLDPAVRRRAAEEAADVFVYLLYLEAALDIDLVVEADATLQRNAVRYPPKEGRV